MVDNEGLTMNDLGHVTRQQLGWYVHNCAKSAIAGRLEPILLARLNCLKNTASSRQYLAVTAKTRAQRMRKLQAGLRV